ncbi:DUF2029 domain-containing protein [Labedella phragmitis]|uniref:DUF2029 domain-containing protein n=1 Tax=Labedella phragmitis TaxID=2498849 RepID=A0A444PPR3_9MICO|nr:glycosyltransferase 87 family protein [Labedella phragmitis]RWZ46422.1 DUF2029 domain-containing protein [Labedella phragmitis]
MKNRYALWTAFVLVHALLMLLSLVGSGNPLVDVTDVYRPWALDVVAGRTIVGIESDWVYPLLALAPLLLPLVAGAAAYPVAWLLLVSLLDAIGFFILLGRGTSPRRAAAAWWWLAFIAALGPIAIDRLDAVTVPLSVTAMLLLVRRPGAAAVLLSVATWIKVWPAALLAAALITVRRRSRLLLAAAVVSAVTLATALLLGAGAHVMSFLTLQTGRGLQVEAPVSLFYLWQTAAGLDGARVYFDEQIVTFQVTGNGVEAVIAVMTPLLALCMTGVAVLGVLAVRAGVSIVRVLPPLSLAFVLVLITVNKVGSPQYLTWLIAPIVLGVVWRGAGFARPAAGALVLAFLTHVIYPYLYALLRDAAWPMVAVITARNLGFVVLLWWCAAELLRVRREARAPRGTVAVPVLHDR